MMRYLSRLMVAAFVLAGTLCTPSSAQAGLPLGITKAKNFLASRIGYYKGPLKSDEVGSALKRAFTGPNASADWQALLNASKAAPGESVEAASKRVEDILKNVLKNPKNPKIQAEISTLADLITGLRNVRVTEIKDGEALLEKAMNGFHQALSKGGNYRTLRNLLTSAYNAQKTANATRALRVLDDLGQIARAGENVPGFQKSFSRWMIELGKKELSGGVSLGKATRKWFGTVGEAKLGRLALEVEGITLKSWNRRLGKAFGKLKGKEGADLVVGFNKKTCALEIKNHDLAKIDPGLIPLKAQQFADQLQKHGKEIGDVSGRKVVVVIMGSPDSQGKFADNLVQNMHKLGATGFKKEQIAFLGVRNGEKFLSDDLAKVLAIGANQQQSGQITSRITAALTAATQ